jgi:hypothetical protein
MYDVFISYARRERDRVEPIKSLLERAGLKVFFDVEGIEAGDEFPDVIDRAVKQAAVVVGIWSPRALTRPWVKRECRVAHERGVLIPVAIEPLDPVKDVPTEFFGLHYHQLVVGDANERSEAWQTLIDEIRRRLPGQHGALPGVGSTRPRLLRHPKIYVSDCGVPGHILVDLGGRLVDKGFDVGETKYSGYYTDVATAYYEQFDIAIIGFGDEASDKWHHAFEERDLLPEAVHVYFQPVDMSNVGYGAPLLGHVLHLEDWKRRPEACLSELLPILKEILVKKGWTWCRTDLPHLELVCRDYWGSAVTNWRQPLMRAGFTLRDQALDSTRRLPHSEIGGARFSLFVWGKRATEDDINEVILRANRGAAIIALVDHEVTIPASLRDACNVFDLRATELNRSVVGTNEWERMLEVLSNALKASDEFAVGLGY